MKNANDKSTLKENVTHGTVSFPLATYSLDGEESYGVKPHWHGEFEILYLEQGNMQLKLNVTEQSVKGPAMVFVEPGVIHSFWMEAYPRESALVFDLKMLSFEYFDSIQHQMFRPMLEGRLHVANVITPESGAWEEALGGYRKIQEILAQMGTEQIKSRRNRIADKLRIKGYLYQIFAALEEQGCFQEEAYQGKEDPYPLETMKKVLHEIHTNYARKLSLDQMASMAGMNPQYFCRFFKRLTGKTFTIYLNEIRIDRAAELLVNTEDKIIQVAGECGFENVGYFIRRFKEMKGSTPSKYRETAGNSFEIAD